ncbi:hypothetical protein C8J44_3140 [Sphingomonas sp. PP-CE-3A-406]|uniref:hypothetical protein n=1 Tax=Sphingomonas sp. PP-CE-3A-406 TaxID=2135659 RepID=UPI000EF97F44|nr:hypothetical protein [Sphingomonas sp. PP-CE-3A-406]RMB52112.1 hypothetical protein C8J44_3140 [Sphingomonas sp. PP-CE-3A-406]
MIRPLFTAAVGLTSVLALSACDRSNEGASVSINADGGNVLGAINGETGEMKIDVPGFQGSVKLPKIKIDTSNFDLNGVRLYPGSSIKTLNIVGDDKAGGLRVAFASPATPTIVRDWFAQRLGKVGYQVHPEGANLIGATDENKPFRLELTPDGKDKATGTIVISG